MSIRGTSIFIDDNEPDTIEAGKAVLRTMLTPNSPYFSERFEVFEYYDEEVDPPIFVSYVLMYELRDGIDVIPSEVHTTPEE